MSEFQYGLLVGSLITQAFLYVSFAVGFFAGRLAKKRIGRVQQELDATREMPCSQRALPTGGTGRTHRPTH